MRLNSFYSFLARSRFACEVQTGFFCAVGLIFSDAGNGFAIFFFLQKLTWYVKFGTEVAVYVIQKGV